MRLTYLKRSINWFWELLVTLTIFWINNPSETPAVARFVFKKATALPKFIDRNVRTEKHEQSFEEKLNKMSRIYEKYKNTFNPKNANSYKALKRVLTSKSQILYFLVRKTKPKVIVETGVAGGESTGYILKAINDNGFGKLFSIDLPFQWYVYGNHELHLDSLPAGKISGYLVPPNLKENWELILGDTYKKLPGLLNKLKKVGVFLHDSEHSYKTMTFEYECAWSYITSEGLLLSDDVNFTKAFDDFSKTKKIKPITFRNLGILSRE